MGGGEEEGKGGEEGGRGGGRKGREEGEGREGRKEGRRGRDHQISNCELMVQTSWHSIHKLFQTHSNKWTFSVWFVCLLPKAILCHCGT